MTRLKFYLLFSFFILLTSCNKNNNNEYNWINGNWEVRTDLSYVQLQLFSDNQCKIFIDASTNGWMSGEYKVNDTSIEVIINDVPIMFTIDKNKHKIFTSNGTEMIKK
jgi:hypothetical protein